MAATAAATVTFPPAVEHTLTDQQVLAFMAAHKDAAVDTSSPAGADYRSRYSFTVHWSPNRAYALVQVNAYTSFDREGSTDYTQFRCFQVVNGSTGKLKYLPDACNDDSGQPISYRQETNEWGRGGSYGFMSFGWDTKHPSRLIARDDSNEPHYRIRRTLVAVAPSKRKQLCDAAGEAILRHASNRRDAIDAFLRAASDDGGDEADRSASLCTIRHVQRDFSHGHGSTGWRAKCYTSIKHIFEAETTLLGLACYLGDRESVEFLLSALPAASGNELLSPYLYHYQREIADVACGSDATSMPAGAPFRGDHTMLFEITDFLPLHVCGPPAPPRNYSHIVDDTLGPRGTTPAAWEAIRAAVCAAQPTAKDATCGVFKCGDHFWETSTERPSLPAKEVLMDKAASPEVVQRARETVHAAATAARAAVVRPAHASPGGLAPVRDPVNRSASRSPARSPTTRQRSPLPPLRGRK